MGPIDELQDYWGRNGLGHLELRIVSLEEIRDHIDLVQFTMIEGWPDAVVACTKLDQETFNRIVFIHNNETDPVIDSDRSILGVSRTIEQRYPNLDDLFSLNSWLQQVGTIYKNFNYKKFGHLLLRVPTSREERSESNDGSSYLEGGNHRSLALAIRTNIDGERFEPIPAIVVLQPLPQRG